MVIETAEHPFDQLSKPARRALSSAGIHRLQDLCKFTESELMSLHGTGPKSITIIRELMLENGLSFLQEKR